MLTSKIRINTRFVHDLQNSVNASTVPGHAVISEEIVDLDGVFWHRVRDQ